MTSRHSRSHSRRRHEGFTLIEVMMAMAVLVVGALGILSMQQAATRGNMTARQLSTASYANQVWLERVRRDALLWNGRNRTDVIPTTYLAGLAAGDVDFFTPGVGPLGNESAAFDYFGNEVPLAQGVFCTHIALNWISVDGSLARVTARTWWHRRGDGTPDTTFADRSIFPNCGQGAEVGVTGELASASPRIRSVQSSLLIRWNRLETP